MDVTPDGQVANRKGLFLDHLRKQPDIELAAEHLRQALIALGLDMSDLHLADTPTRVARMYVEMLGGGESFALTTFPMETGSVPNTMDIVLIRDIPFTSFCAHHLLPFTGCVHIGYVPQDRIAGISKLARVVDAFAKRPQVQERLTNQIADALMEVLRPSGVGVFVSASHACMEIRGVRATGALTVTSTFRGTLEQSPAQDNFWALLR